MDAICVVLGFTCSNKCGRLGFHSEQEEEQEEEQEVHFKKKREKRIN